MIKKAVKEKKRDLDQELKTKKIPLSKDEIYKMIAYLVSGPANAGDAGKVISRTVEIKGSQSLEALHKIIFKAFGREDESLYEFIIGKNAKYRGDIEYPVRSRKYYITATNSPDNPLEVVSSSIKISSLDLKPEERFLYIYDFGDEWIHMIDTVSIDGTSDGKKYPRITEKEGKAPPQYQDEEA